MIKRWLIRSLFLLPLVCVVGLWVASYFIMLNADRWSYDHFWHLSLNSGLVGAVKEPIEPLSNPKLWIWTSQIKRQEDGLLVGGYEHCPIRLFGFGLHWLKWDGSYEIWRVIVPLWFPTLLLAGLNWLIWRKTRLKPIGRAFPVEPTAASGEPTP